jgi:hypothetical protein
VTQHRRVKLCTSWRLRQQSSINSGHSYLLEICKNPNDKYACLDVIVLKESVATRSFPILFAYLHMTVGPNPSSRWAYCSRSRYGYYVRVPGRHHIGTLLLHMQIADLLKITVDTLRHKTPHYGICLCVYVARLSISSFWRESLFVSKPVVRGSTVRKPQKAETVEMW